MRKKILYFIVFTFFLSSGFSQILDTKNDKYWIDGGLGRYFATYKTESIALGFSANLLKNNTIYGGRFIHYQELWLFGPEPSEKFNEFGILIGKGFYGEYLQIQFLGGIGIFGGYKRGDYLYTDTNNLWFKTKYYEKEKFVTAYIPIGIDIQIKPFKYLGLGVSLFGNLNIKTPLYGFIVKIGIGKL